MSASQCEAKPYKVMNGSTLFCDGSVHYSVAACSDPAKGCDILILGSCDSSECLDSWHSQDEKEKEGDKEPDREEDYPFDEYADALARFDFLCTSETFSDLLTFNQNLECV